MIKVVCFCLLCFGMICLKLENFETGDTLPVIRNHCSYSYSITSPIRRLMSYVMYLNQLINITR